MGENSGISWTDHTFNPWWGCQKVSPACQFCYAERESNRFGQRGLWESNNRRFFDTVKHWAQPVSWDIKAKNAGKIARVFSGSMCDVFELVHKKDNPHVYDQMNAARESLWSLIDSTKNLEWLLLTKRPENILQMIPAKWIMKNPPNVRIGVTAENQACADMRIPELLRLWKGKNFVSVEPMLSEIDITRYLIPRWVKTPTKVTDSGAPVYLCTACGRESINLVPCKNLECVKHRSIDWVIAGGESGTMQVRATRPEWVRKLRDQCIATGVPFFFKQWGSIEFHEHKGELIQIYVGTNKTNLLDGVEWHQFPRI